MTTKQHFIIAGAQRSGTTYLYNMLCNHPDICMAQPVKPEPKFFLTKYNEDMQLQKYYNSFFTHCTGDFKVYGEKSTSYYEKEESAIRISALLPDAKIIFILRNPVQRALSNYFFSVNNGLEQRDVWQALIEDETVPEYAGDISVNPYDYKKRGNYVDFLQTYSKYFSKQQIKVIIFEEFVNDLDTLKNLYDFIGVERDFIPEKFGSKINESEKNGNVSEEVFKYLEEYYAKSIIDLEKFLGRDLSVWQPNKER